MSYFSDNFPDYKIRGVTVTYKKELCVFCDKPISDGQTLSLVVEVKVPKSFDPVEHWPDNDDRGNTVLCWACANGYDDSQEYLLTDQDFSTNVQDRDLGIYLQKGFTFKGSKYLFITIDSTHDTDSEIVDNEVECTIAHWKFDPDETYYMMGEETVGRWNLKKQEIRWKNPNKRLILLG